MRPETGYFLGANQSCILKRGILRGPHDSYLYRKYVQDLFANRVSMFQSVSIWIKKVIMDTAMLRKT